MSDPHAAVTSPLRRRLRKRAAALAAALLALTLGACGNKGPLYLPDSPPVETQVVEPADGPDTWDEDRTRSR